MHPIAQDCQRSIFHLGLPTNDALPGATPAIRGRVRWVIATVRWPTERLAQARSTMIMSYPNCQAFGCWRSHVDSGRDRAEDAGLHAFQPGLQA